MARKGNQQKKGWDPISSNNKKGNPEGGCGCPDTEKREKDYDAEVATKELPHGAQPSSHFSDGMKRNFIQGDVRKRNKRSGKTQKRGEPGIDAVQGVQHSVHNNLNGGMDDISLSKDGISDASVHNAGGIDYLHGSLLDSLQTKEVMRSVQLSYIVAVESLRAFAFSVSKTVSEWVDRQMPFFTSVRSKIQQVRSYIATKFSWMYPILLRWIVHVGNILLLVSLVWLNCAFRGMNSFLHMGTTAFFVIIWCSILSMVAMIGMLKFLLVLAIAAVLGIFVGFIVALLAIALSGAILLWFYGSFWITSLVIVSSGLVFSLSRERIALLITSMYSVYCAWIYAGWVGLLLGFNLAFLSSDALVYFLSSLHEQRNPPEQTAGVADQQNFNDESNSYSEIGSGPSADRSPGVTSTSGTDNELTSEYEVARLLNCTDHYSVLGLSRYDQVDVSVLKREYRKKAMLVHPDKNMGNERAVEAFKKLQNAYEILLDSLKRKTYDDELRREELLNYFRRFQSTSQQNGQHGLFSGGFSPSGTDFEDPLEEPRRIACKKCGSFHIWVQTKKSKAQARWCQDCKDFHQAKDGDGWVEQSSKPLFFGIIQKVDAPIAYVCADSRIYNATEWYICQGMRCPANSHKPTFHVNTSVTKQSHGKGTSSSQRGGMPPNVDESVTEEEFFVWLQSAVQSGMFDNFAGGTSSDGTPMKAGDGFKSGVGGSGSSSSKRKKKGKKQW